MLVASLPDALLSEIFSDWIELKNLAKLDSSVTNRGLRQNFLDILGNDVVFLCHHNLTPVFQNWLYVRSISIDRISYVHESFDKTSFQL